jgi:antitoxin (DNA-binding transcriptional repressor) of toxin-antitoxin stability system
MTTELISISEYRKNISVVVDRAARDNTCFIITAHGKPIGEYRPLKQEDIVVTRKYSQSFIDEIARIDQEPTLSDVDTLFAQLLK